MTEAGTISAVRSSAGTSRGWRPIRSGDDRKEGRGGGGDDTSGGGPTGAVPSPLGKRWISHSIGQPSANPAPASGSTVSMSGLIGAKPAGTVGSRLVPDVIVIGGGVVGTMTAWHLAEAGASVTLLERGALASGATGRSQGLVLPPDYAELVPLWRESIAVYTRLADEHGADFCFDREPIGTLLLATHAGQLAAPRARAGRRRPARCGAASPRPSRRSREGMAGGLLIAEGRRTDPGALAACGRRGGGGRRGSTSAPTSR